jgi:hypothetical protein
MGFVPDLKILLENVSGYLAALEEEEGFRSEN